MLGYRNQQLLNEAIALCQQGGVDPATGMKNLAVVLERLLRLKSRFEAPKPTDRVYTVPFVGSVIVASGGITPIGTTTMNWPKDGLIVGMKATVREGLSLVTHITLSVKDETQYPFFSNGTGDGFVSPAILQGNVYDQGGWFPLFEGMPVKASTQWYLQASSADSLPVSGSTSYTPEVCFLVDESPDAQKVVREMADAKAA